ncbi:MAG: hypothetical protein JWN96_4523 [Mycobacterium sp.]|jgi:hypothetical protein|nr:hypothetical protein [Mycobacterium sp.]
MGVGSVVARSGRLLTLWRLSRAISRKPVPRFRIVAERRSEGLAALLVQLLINEEVPAALHYAPGASTILDGYEVVVAEEHAVRAREVLTQYGEG